MEKKNLFISESSIGNHIASDIFNANHLSFTFYPAFKDISKNITNVDEVVYFIKNTKNFYLNGTNCFEEYEKNCKNKIEDFIISLNPKNIFIGFDLDIMGQIMASILYYRLILKGFNEENIIRVPLTDEGYIRQEEKDSAYIAFGDFYEYEELLSILNAIRLEYLLISKTKAGFRKMEILEIINDRRLPDVYKRKNLGTNTVTYMFKYLYMEN